MWHLDQDMAICSQTLPLCSIMQQYFIIYQIPATTYKKKSGQKVAWKKCTEKSDVVDQFISARGKKFWDVDLDWFEEYCVMDQDISWGTGYDNRDMRELEGCYTIFLFRHNITKMLQYHDIKIPQYHNMGDRLWQPWHERELERCYTIFLFRHNINGECHTHTQNYVKCNSEKVSKTFAPFSFLATISLECRPHTHAKLCKKIQRVLANILTIFLVARYDLKPLAEIKKIIPSNMDVLRVHNIPLFLNMKFL